MADLSDINGALPIKIIGSNSSGVEQTPVNSTLLGELLVKDSADGPVVPGTVATMSQLAGGQYNSTPPTLTNTQQVALQVDVNGQLFIDDLDSTTDNVGAVQFGYWKVGLTVPSGDMDVGYGTVGIKTLRVAGQIGNATGAASFGAGTTSAQTLRVVLPTDQSAIPVTGTFFQATQPVSIAGTVAVSGPLTDTQLRASAVPVSLASTTITGSVAVTGPLTDTQLRASAVPVTLTSTTITGTVAVTQSTSPWVVSGTVTATPTGTQDENLIKVAGVTLGATAVTNYGTAPAAVAVPGVNAFITNTPAVTLTSTTLTGTSTVAGNKTNNNAAPGATNLGVLPALATAAAQTWTEGNLVLLSTLLNGSLRIDNTSWLGSTAPTVGQKTMANSIPVTMASDQSNINVSQATASSLNAQVQGPAASGSAKSGNPVQSGGVFNTTEPTVTTGQVVELQTTNRGFLKTANTPIKVATYFASITGLVLAATPTDVFSIVGSGTKKVTIKRITITGNRTTAGFADILLIKRSTANTVGTSTSPTIIPNDSTNAAGTAVVKAYTANPTLGTAVGTIVAKKYFVNVVTAQNDELTINFGTENTQGIILNSAAENLNINFNSVTQTGSNFDIYIEFTEE